MQPWTRSVIAELGLIDECEFVVQPRLAGHGPTLFAGLSKHLDFRLVSRLEFGWVDARRQCTADIYEVHWRDLRAGALFRGA